MNSPSSPSTYFQRRLEFETDCADVWHRVADNDPRLVLLDVRARSDFAARHIPGAVSLPHGEITAEVLERFDAATQFVTYCWGPHCNGATKGAARIADLGRPVAEMLGGMWGWEQEGYRFEGADVGVRVGLLCFAMMDLLDLGGPYEVLHTANRLRERLGEPPVFSISTIGDRCRAFGGIGVVPEMAAADVDWLDVLIVPGAIDVNNARPDPDLAYLAPRSDVVASVCTGALFLDRNDLLGEGPITTHWEDADALGHREVLTDRRWVDNGTVITAGGIASGIAMALHLVERFGDRALAEATARQVDYVWTESRPV